MASLSTLVPTNYVLTSGQNSIMSWTNVLTLSTANCSTVNASSMVTNSIGANALTLNSTLSVSTLTARTVNVSTIAGSSISSNTLTLSLVNVSTQNTQIYQVATTNPTTSYTAIQASHVSTGTTNNALALNPSGGNVGVGTTVPQATLHVQGGTLVTNPTVYNTAVAGWFIIGLWDCSAAPNIGAHLKLRVTGCNGYDNAVSPGNQMGGETTIYLNNLNNINTTTLSNIDGMWKHEGGLVPIMQVKAVQNGSSRSQYFVYAFMNTFTQHSITAETTQGTIWTSQFTSTTDPGANSLTVRALTLSSAAVGANVGIGTVSPAALLDVNGTARINANTYLSGEAGLMPLLMNSSGVIKTPVVGAFSFTAGGSGSAQGPTMTSITGNTGIYGIVATGAGSGSLFFAFYNTSSGALSNVFSTSADGFSFMFTITGGRLTWNYASLPTTTWIVNYRVIPIISY